MTMHVVVANEVRLRHAQLDGSSEVADRKNW
jgi:hypothetical protein